MKITIIIIIYINDQTDIVESNVYVLSDDTKICRSINSLNEHNILHHDIDNPLKWFSNWLLTFHPDVMSWKLQAQVFRF